MAGRTARSDRKTPKKWRGYYRDADGGQHAKMFATVGEAKAWERENLTNIAKGTWTDPKKGKITFGEYAGDWFEMQVWRGSTEARIRSILDVHLLPAFGAKELSKIQPSHVQAWVKALKVVNDDGSDRPYGARYVGSIYGLLAQIMVAAVADRMINVSPCSKRIKRPAVESGPIRPLTREQVALIRSAFPERLQAIVTLSAKTGMRQGECLGLTVDRVDFLRREIHVDRQAVAPSGKPAGFGPPKTKASNRVVPLSKTLGLALSAHIAEHHVGEHGLLFTNGGTFMRRHRVNEAWNRALAKAKVADPTFPDATFHDLRHHFASLLISAGVSVKGVQEALGHSDPAETLRTYTHLWPTDHDRIRQALDAEEDGVLPTLLPKTAE